MPDGVVNVVTTVARPPVSAAVLARPAGAQAVLHRVHRGRPDPAEGRRPTASINCSMELGGNAPFLVFDDADLDAALDGAMMAKMRNGGEACTAANRFYVHEAVADEFTAAFAAAAGGAQGRPGPRRGHRARPAGQRGHRGPRWPSLVDEAAGRGQPGGHRRFRPGPPRLLLRAHRAGPTCRPAPASWTRRSSARSPRSSGSAPRPTRSRWANDTEYGLVSYVYTRDLRRGLRVAEALEAGMVGINRGVVSDPAAPFGGVKQSGIGREGGHDGLAGVHRDQVHRRQLVTRRTEGGPLPRRDTPHLVRAPASVP